MIAFVKSLINDLDENYLKTLDSFVNMDDETLISLKKKESKNEYKEERMLHIIDKFQKFNYFLTSFYRNFMQSFNISY